MATGDDSDRRRPRVLVILLGVGLMGALYVLGSVFEPTDIPGLAAFYGAYLGAFVLAGIVLVKVYVPSFDDEDLEVDEGPPTVEWDDDWGVSAVEVATALGLAVLLVLGGRASLALGPIALVAFLTFMSGVGVAVTRWLYAPESGRAAVDRDHPFTTPEGVVKRQTHVFENLVGWFVLATVPLLFLGPTPVELAGRTVEIPPAAFTVAALCGLAATHWVLTRPLVGS
ncbi:hypothetical protein C475_17293 [Halosimplex carlsbadense 2-9-1]|uniref:Uncharacterized protein n=1 Tax=Halosimplex carlsbadense 2-9-1 TaxID=797114 RepID=M0CK74_9EURY|nr:hypothetical protein [Halosimplex carlsbadense]ELZ22289.1 hypothetical protein C475_17293 [Halosimplex carlsbadense 2-9-1]